MRSYLDPGYSAVKMKIAGAPLDEEPQARCLQLASGSVRQPAFDRSEEGSTPVCRA
jgi:hypothetical protein